MNTVDTIWCPDAGLFAMAYFDHLHAILQRIDVEEISRFAATLMDARERGATIFFIGNGGSAATASHFSNDLAVGTHVPGKPFRALSLTDNLPLITAIGNDFGYEKVFEQQLRVFGRQGDVLVAISASGNSPNLVAAIEYAKAVGMKSVALTAFDGGRIRQLADDGIHVPTALGDYGPAEDAHLVLDHLLHAFLRRLTRTEKNGLAGRGGLA